MKSLAWACRGPGAGIGALRRMQRCDVRGEAAPSSWWPDRGTARCAGEASPQADARARAFKTVLVVDDEPDICTMLGFVLTQAGFPVERAFDGEEGLAAVRRAQPALVVLDWMMPGLSGIEICRMLRADPATADTRILMLSARAERSDLAESHAAGADDHLVKPFARNELLRRVRALTAE